jgi:hypothetical protein
MFKLFKTSLIVSCIFIGSISTCFADFTCQSGRVERAGVALIKRYPSSKPNLEYTVLVGIDAHRTKTIHLPLANGRSGQQNIAYVNFFAGKCEDQKHKCQYSSQVAANELSEETGGAVKINPNIIKNLAYVYSGDFARNTPAKNYIQLFFYRNDNYSVDNITAAQRRACQNLNNPRALREVRATTAIPLQELLNRVRSIAILERTNRMNEAKAEKWYVFQTRGNGYGQDQKWVYLDPQYMRNLARDLNRFERICAQLSNGRVR